MSRILFFPAFLVLFSMLTTQGGEIILESGEKVQGQILEVNELVVVISAQVSDTIFEERRIPRSQVREIKRSPRDKSAFLQVEQAQLPETALSPNDYTSYINLMQNFLRDYGYSDKIEKVREYLKKAEAERERVQNGEIKLQGRWLDEEETKTETYELAALREFGEMQEVVERGNPLGALNRFSVLEQDYSGSSIFPDAITLALQQIDVLHQLLEHEQRNFPILEEQREKNMLLASPADQASMKAARERQIEQMDAAIERAQKSGVKFPPYSQVYPASMSRLQGHLEKEKQRLLGLDRQAMERSLEATRQGFEFLSQRELPSAQGAANRALELWPQCERAKRLSEQVKTLLEAQEAADEAQRKSIAEGEAFGEADDSAKPKEEPKEEK